MCASTNRAKSNPVSAMTTLQVTLEGDGRIVVAGRGGDGAGTAVSETALIG
ncbi:hypothetical protein [Rhodococcus sp. RD6.2]|uniref:hypothetical protein n=1 Tax=Rhodococcus sp. RD6.2 TaxID=260936 RepID=UPI000AC3797D|nr:hypothetical protein [Rhodococcus sp. RD6.2]